MPTALGGFLAKGVETLSTQSYIAYNMAIWSFRGTTSILSDW